MAFAWLTAEAGELLGHHFAGAADFSWKILGLE